MPRGVEIGRGYIAVDTEDDEARERLKSFGVLAAKAFAYAAAGAGILVGATAAVGIQFNSMKEQAEVAFTTLLGSGEAARGMLADLQKFAASTPFELPGLIDNARQLLGVGVAADQVIPTLTALGNTAGALGINQDAFNRILLATTQAMGKGKLQGEELMQMVENGIPVWQLLSKALGKPVEELQKLSSDGKLLSNEVLPLLFDQMQKDYGGAMVAQSKTLVGTWSSLKDNAKNLAGIGFKPLFEEAKNVVGALGELAASDKGQEFAARFASGLELAIKQTKAFVNGARLSLGGELGDTLDIAKARASTYFETFKTVGKNAFDGLGDVIKRLLPQINSFFNALGFAVEPALKAFSSVSESFARNADGIGEALNTALGIINGVAGPAFALLGSAVTAAASAISGLLNLINSMPGAFGSIAGVLAAGLIGWRLLGGSIADATRVLGIFSTTGAVAGGLTGLATKVDDIAVAAAGLAEKFTGSSKAGMGLVNTGTAISGAMRGLAGIIPAVGGALAAAGAILAAYLVEQNNIKDAAQGMARALSEGGQKARDAAAQLGRLKGELAGVEAQQRAWNNSLEATQAGADDVFGGQLGDKAGALKGRIAEVDKQFVELTKNMGPAELAQANYNRAVAEYGPNSDQAAQSSALWRAALADEKLKNEQAAAATKTHIDKLLELQATQLGILNTDIGYRQSLGQLETAQARAADATAKYGSASQEAKDANLALEQALAGTIDAAGRHAAAQNSSKSAEEQATAAMNAQNAEAIRLVGIMGSNAPASLQRFVANMDASQLAALGVTAKVNEAGQAVLVMPDGKEVKLIGNNADAMAKIKAVNDAELKDKYSTIWINTIETRDVRESTNGTGGRWIGGATRPGVPYMVGERGAEMLFEDRAQYVATAAQTRSMLNGMGSGAGSGPSIHQTINTSPGMSEQNVADLAAAGIAWRSRF